MTPSRNIAMLVGVAILVSGCSFVSDSLWPTLTGNDPKEPAPRASTQAARQSAQSPARPKAQPLRAQPQPRVAPPRLGTTSFVPRPATPGSPTGTFVGRKVVALRNDLTNLQSTISGHNNGLQRIRTQTVGNAQQYHSSVASVNARLQIGTTPGNPLLVQQWNTAQSQLERIGDDVAQMNTLANGVASDSTMASFLLESVRAAYGLSGAIDADHRQLAVLEDDVNRTVVLIDRLLNELTEDINRQNSYLNSERGNLNTLSLAIKNGELLGTSLANRAFSTAAPVASARVAPAKTALSATTRRLPLVVIRFDRKKPEYERALYTAVGRALERRPNAAFDLVAVAPNRGSPAQVALNSNTAKRNAETVLRSLTDMGLPAGRINLSATTSASAVTNEVHIYLR